VAFSSSRLGDVDQSSRRKGTIRPLAALWLLGDAPQQPASRLYPRGGWRAGQMIQYSWKGLQRRGSSTSAIGWPRKASRGQRHAEPLAGNPGGGSPALAL